MLTFEHFQQKIRKRFSVINKCSYCLFPDQRSILPSLLTFTSHSSIMNISESLSLYVFNNLTAVAMYKINCQLFEMTIHIMPTILLVQTHIHNHLDSFLFQNIQNHPAA